MLTAAAVNAGNAEIAVHEAFKDKVSAGFDVKSSLAGVRLWFSEIIGIDAKIGYEYSGDSNYAARLFMITPLFESQDVYVNVIGGLDFRGTPVKDFYEVFGAAGIEFEVFLTAITANLSVSSTVELYAGSETRGDNSFFRMGTGINPLTVRYYF